MQCKEGAKVAVGKRLSRKSKKTISIVSIVISAVVCISIIGSSFLYDYICRTRKNVDFEEIINYEVKSSTLYIVSETATISENAESFSYGAGFGGVVFSEADGVYYALTALHAVDNNPAHLYVLSYDDLTYNERIAQQEQHIGLRDYYKTLPIAEVVYSDEEYDLAILKFSCSDSFGILNIASNTPAFKDQVAIISSPLNEGRNEITYGTIISKKPVKFGDANGENQRLVIRTSAYDNFGSSGSVLLNKQLEIAGIVLGGGRDIFDNFRYSLVMPANEINDFITTWYSSKK